MVQRPELRSKVLPEIPSIQVVHHMLAEALESQDTSIQVAWKTADQKSLFTLTVKADPVGLDPRWHLNHASEKGSETLWEYSSCDTLIVLNRVLTSCGEVMSPAQLTGGTTISQAPSRDDQEATSSKEDEFYYTPSALTQRKTTPLPVMTAQTSLAKRNTVLNGELSFIQISALLQSILLAKMTGRLQVDSGEGAAEVFFVDGKPVHATTPQSKGDECIFELVSWQDGKFFFQPQVLTKKRTVTEGLDSLIIQGVQLLDKYNFLKNLGFRNDCILAKANENLTEVDLATMLSIGDPAHIEMQRRIYSAIDSTTPADELIKYLGLQRSRWIPALSHLFRCKLVTVRGDQHSKGKRALAPKPVDSAAIQAVMMKLRRADTGMFNYPAFLYFLEQEYFRGHRAGTPLSVIIFELRVKTGVKDVIREPLPASALNEAVLRIMTEKRHNDMVAHYESFDYALLCPDTKGEGAGVFARRLVKALTKEPLSPHVNANNLSLSFGIACVPEDFLEMGLLLAAAEAARAHSIETDQSVVMYRDIP
jgi:FOG: GGDEF domain